ncbi:MAG TPA: protein kinase [Candidatus Binatia bacterium]
MLAGLAPGSRVAETYDVLRVIAEGDISTIYLVWHRHWNIEIALRVPNAQLLSIAGTLGPFVARAEQWIALGLHPNIVPCYHVHSLHGVPLILAEFVEGVTLRAWLAGDPQDRLRQGLDVAIQVCHALEHAHGRGVAHGACTPEHIMIARGSVAKLLNFGLPLSGAPNTPPAAPRAAGSEGEIDERYALAALMREAPYVAPERWQQPTAPALTGDVFALGVCLWELFGGARPYDSTATETQPAMRELRLGQDDARTRLATLSQRCVAWDAASRPSDVAEIRDQLSTIYAMLFRETPVSRLPESTEADRLNAAAVNSLYSGRLADAEQAWEAALELDPGHLDSLFNRAVAHWRQGTITDEALTQHLEKIALPPTESWKVRWLIGLTHLERGDLGSAEAFLEQAWRQGPGVVEVTQALERVQFRRQSMEHPALVVEHFGFVSAVDLSAAGKIALAASGDAVVMVWDLASGKRLQALEGHDGGVTAAVLSADGQAAFTGGDDGTIRVWDVATGACRHVFAVELGRVVSLSVSPDGSLLLSAANRGSEQTEALPMQLWDIHSGECRRVFGRHAGTIKSVFLSVDGRYAVSGGDDHLIRLWDVEFGHCVKTFAGHDHFVSGVCLSPDGGLILSASWDKTLRLWNRLTGRCLRVFSGHSASVAAACLSADAVWAASGGWDGTVRLWEVATGRCLRTIHAHQGLVTAVALSANGDRVLSGSWDGTIRSWDISPELREACRLRTTGT